jgi:acyl-CoA thioesterase YciA
MELTSSFICKTSDIGVNDTLFGGVLLSKFDESCAIFCQKKCESPNMVTLKISEVLFKRPVKVGQVISIYGELKRMGTTSVTIDLEGRKFNVHTGNEEIVATTTMVFVRIDDEGNPIPIDKSVRDRY